MKKDVLYWSKPFVFGAVIIFVIMICSRFFNDEQIIKIKVMASDIEQKGARNAIQEALNVALNNPTGNKQFEITVEKGNYVLDGFLSIYGNTTLNLDDVELTRNKDTSMLRVGKIERSGDKRGKIGYYYKNIHMVGGVLDGGGYSGTVLKCGHVADLSISKVQFRNSRNGHFVELAGVDGAIIEDCDFYNQIIDNTKVNTRVYEAVQLDVLEQNHMPNYRSEVLQTQNIVVERCRFSHVPRGIGSHSTVLNQPFCNINIKECDFSEIESVAIQGLNWEQVEIEDNVISGTPRGIALYANSNNGGTYLPSYIAEVGGVETKVSDDYILPKRNQEINIIRNEILLNDNEDPYVDYVKAGISVTGYIIDENAEGEETAKIPTGNYYISGINIEQNQIITEKYGIRVLNTQNGNVKNNFISYMGQGKEIKYGIDIGKDCIDLQLKDNVIEKGGILSYEI